MLPIKLNLPENFLNEEERSDYLVKAHMKKVWAVELDLLNELLQVCRKHNLNIYVAGGTMIGVARHKGFIPWDDDIDTVMLRSDYEKLCKIAPQEFSHPYFFQTEETDPGSIRGHAQLRNSETTAILAKEKEWKFPFNQGIFIDIFPLDTVNDDSKLFWKQAKKIKKLKKLSLYYSLFTSRYTKFAPNKFIQFGKDLLHFFVKNRNQLKNPYYEAFENLCIKYNDIENSKWITSLSLTACEVRHQKLRSDFETTVYLPFEFLEVPLPVGYLNILSHEYGNWQEYKKENNSHGGLFLDPDKSYKEYI